ncbi:MAG: hypothetical protein WEB58_18190 [Planctomycetaceae bacterium]
MMGQLTDILSGVLLAIVYSDAGRRLFREDAAQADVANAEHE